MYNKKKGGTIGVIITVIILIIIVILSNTKTGQVSPVGNAINTIVMPIQNGYTYLKNKMTGISCPSPVTAPAGPTMWESLLARQDHSSK